MFIMFVIYTNIGPDGSWFETIVNDRKSALDMCCILEKSDYIFKYKCNMTPQDLGTSQAALTKHVNM